MTEFENTTSKSPSLKSRKDLAPLGWRTPAERYDGTLFLDHGFENIPALAHLQNWLQETIRAA